MSETQFVLRFPFRLFDEFSGFEKPLLLRADPVMVTISSVQPFLVASAEPFATEDEAKSYLPRLWGALAWLAASIGTGFSAEMELGNITYSVDPVAAAENLARSMSLSNRGPVHGLGDGNSPTVFRQDQNIRHIIFGDAQVRRVVSRAMVEGPFLEGLRCEPCGLAFGDERLRTAIDLYSNSNRELSIRSRFLTLMMAIEVLTEPERKHPVALEVLDRLGELIAEKAKEHDAASEESHALDSLRREVRFRKETSIRTRVRRVVLTQLTSLSSSEREQRAIDVVRAYDLRGTLVHDGHVPAVALRECYDIARRTVMELLQARLRGTVSPK